LGFGSLGDVLAGSMDFLPAKGGPRRDYSYLRVDQDGVSRSTIPHFHKRRCDEMLCCLPKSVRT